MHTQIYIYVWHFQVEKGSLWDREYKAWNNVKIILLDTHSSWINLLLIHL